MYKINVVNNTPLNITVNKKENNNIEIVIDSVCEKVRVSDLKPGQVFKGDANTPYIFLGLDEYGMTDILRKNLLPDVMKFGDNNNFNGSIIDKYLSATYLKELERDFGVENIIEREFDLTSFDGFDDYGKIKRKVALLDFNRYRKYHKIMGDDMPNFWWLIDSNSTPSGIGSDCVRCVRSDGRVSYSRCNWGNWGVRPFLSLNPKTMVSII